MALDAVWSYTNGKHTIDILQYTIYPHIQVIISSLI